MKQKTVRSNGTRRGVLRIILAAVISLVFGFGLYTWNASALGNRMPMPFGIGVGVIMSGSMEPELSVDDVILVKTATAYEEGDVVVFQQKGELIVHKIILVEGTTVTTKGTANNVADEPISISAIKGKVVGHIGGLGGLITWIRSPLGTGLVLVVAVGLLAGSYASEKKQDAQKQETLEEIRREIERLKHTQDGTPAALPADTESEASAETAAEPDERDTHTES
ncbi:MAG: signal peptidase I [Clostridia bacterium]|nr:signal peptidase I [Clostridia bacterium]